MKAFPPYSGADLDRLAAMLPPLSDDRISAREMIADAAITYRNRKGFFEDYYRRRETEKECRETIEAIDKTLAALLPWGPRWEAASDAEVFAAGAKECEKKDSDFRLWPAYSEITRRSLLSYRAMLQQRLEVANPFERTSVQEPGRNDKRPERGFIEALLNVFAYAHQLRVQDVPIGNDPRSNEFLRFARECTDVVVGKWLTDVAIRDHARAVRDARRRGLELSPRGSVVF
ncbi:hypothetical protein [Neoaquamicrobium sediminum]|uniref:hypothetical protein n=1 Tax=Neoaquamicrobium sediminum TaxID=1849104 RepID=UPI00362325EB